MPNLPTVMAKYYEMSDTELRGLSVCPACLGIKNTGEVVCWDCFKHKGPFPGLLPLKYSELSLHAWLHKAADTRRTIADNAAMVGQLSLQGQ